MTVLRFECSQAGVHLLTLLKRVRLMCFSSSLRHNVSFFFVKQVELGIAVGILTRLRTRQPSSRGLFSKEFRSALKLTLHSIRWVPGALSPRLKQPARESDDSSSSSIEVE